MQRRSSLARSRHLANALELNCKNPSILLKFLKFRADRNVLSFDRSAWFAVSALQEQGRSFRQFFALFGGDSRHQRFSSVFFYQVDVNFEFHRAVLQAEHPRADGHWNAHDDALGDAVDVIRAPVQRCVEQMIRSFLERSQHEYRVFHLCHAETRDPENPALVRHDVGEQHRVSVVD